MNQLGKDAGLVESGDRELTDKIQSDIIRKVSHLLGGTVPPKFQQYIESRESFSYDDFQKIWIFLFPHLFPGRQGVSLRQHWLNIQRSSTCSAWFEKGENRQYLRREYILPFLDVCKKRMNDFTPGDGL